MSDQVTHPHKTTGKLIFESYVGRASTIKEPGLAMWRKLVIFVIKVFGVCLDFIHRPKTGWFFNLLCVPSSEFCATLFGTCKLAADPVSRGSGSEDNIECVDDNMSAISVLLW